jgi:hypothetical protein
VLGDRPPLEFERRALSALTVPEFAGFAGSTQ